MIRTSVQNGKHIVSKLALPRETIRVLGDSELSAVGGGADSPPCINTNRASGCSGFLLDGDVFFTK